MDTYPQEHTPELSKREEATLDRFFDKYREVDETPEAVAARLERIEDELDRIYESGGNGSPQYVELSIDAETARSVISILKRAYQSPAA